MKKNIINFRCSFQVRVVPLHLRGKNKIGISNLCQKYICTVEVPHPEPETKVFTSDVTIKDGYAFVGNKPGLGIEVNYEELAKHKVEKVSQKAGPSPYGRRPGAGLYEIPPTKEEISEGQSK